jgi:intraflagellar transport protein 88
MIHSYDKLGNIPQAMEWFNILISAVPTDPGILARLGDMFVKINDKPQAFQYYSEVNGCIYVIFATT